MKHSVTLTRFAIFLTAGVLFGGIVYGILWVLAHASDDVLWTAFVIVVFGWALHLTGKDIQQSDVENSAWQSKRK